VEIPSIGVNMPIVGVPLVEDEWDVSWLWNEAGWLNGTAFPGWQGNSALTGHITLPNGRPGPFAMLGNLQWGDKIIVHAYGTVYTYEVRETRTVSPDNVSILKHEEDSWITLITCKTYDKATNTYSRRTAVRAILVSTTTDKQTKEARGGR
jgi:LPXTG-site transpeptidase (sortase) family protein